MRKTRKSLFLLRLVALGLIVACGVFLTNAIIFKVSAATPINKSYISAFEIKSSNDGTAPFDSNDDPGNDSSEHNGIVRTFDHVNYNLSYITKLMPGETVVDDGNLMIEFTLDVDPSVAEFDQDTLNWLLDQKNTYYYEDGTSSSNWDSTKKVEKQVLIGRRYLSVDENGTNAIPGAGSLSAGLYIKAAKNGQKITPKFTVYMEGNEESLYKTLTSGTVTVSAAPKYNLTLLRNTSDSPMGWFNLGNGNISNTNTGDDIKGRLNGFTVLFKLNNDSVDKKLKGIELPNGSDISFKITAREMLDINGVTSDVTEQQDYKPILWDYRESNINNTVGLRGKLGRMMSFRNSDLNWGRFQGPENNNGPTATKCYNGGSIVLKETGDTGVYDGAISGYKFDLKNLVFPTRMSTYSGSAYNSTVHYAANVGVFSVGYFEIVAHFPETVDTLSTLRLEVLASDFRATSMSGVDVRTETSESDNLSTNQVTLTPTGSYSAQVMTKNANELEWAGSSNSKEYGGSFQLRSYLSVSGDLALTAYNVLIKFDDGIIEIPSDPSYSINISSGSKIGSKKLLFTAKPDKSGWIDDKELNDAREENLIYFDDINKLNAAGYSCVGVLVEVRDSVIYNPSNDIYISAKVKDDPLLSGKVAQIKIETRAWREDRENQQFSWTDMSHQSGAFGLGDSDWIIGEYVDGYSAPTYAPHYDYNKVVYKNGVIVSGHTNGAYGGNSLLVTGAQNKVNITVDDLTSTTTGEQTSKVFYDLDKGEREATFKISPSILVLSDNVDGAESEQVTDVTITTTIPADLHYIMGSASIDPSDITSDGGGNTTITWELKDQKVGQAIDPVYYKVTIGAAGTVDDVKNNDKFVLMATISSGVDQRKISLENGTISETSIAVIKLATSSVSKTAAQPLIESGDDISYKLNYGNSDEDSTENVRMVDILPYPGDSRGSEFSGSYVVKSIDIDFSNANKTFDLNRDVIKVYYTTDARYRELSLSEDVLNNKIGETWSELSNVSIDEESRTIVINNLNLNGVVAIYYNIGDVQSKEYVASNIVLSPKDENDNLLAANGSTQQPADIYANNFYEYADNQIGVVTSNNVFSQVVLRTLSGKLWYDKNQNGVQDDDEPVLPNVAVNLLDNSGVVAKNILGKTFAQIKTDANGEYTFELLGPGEHRVQIAGGDYGLTVKDEGDNDAIDSDATPSVANGRLTYANIDKTMPAASAMFAYRYDDQNNDAGFTRTAIKLNKVNNKGEILTGAEFSLGGKKYEATDGHFEIVELGSGRFSLIETLSPVGYKISGPWTVVSEVAADGFISARIDGITAETDGSYSLKDDLNDSSTKSKITKSSVTESITSKDQNVDYKITYEVEVEDYMGDAKIQIVDQLSLPIIAEESELAGGEYDPDELTITWEEDWNDINTYTGEASHTFEYEISLKYEGIEATDRSLHNDVSGTITLLDVESDVTDRSESGSNDDDADTPIKIPGRIRRRFVDKETGEEVCGSIVSSDLVGESFTSEPIVCEGWELVEGPDHDDYVFEEDEQEIIYRYRKIKNPETTAASLKAVGVNGAIVFTVATGLVWFARRRR